MADTETETTAAPDNTMPSYRVLYKADGVEDWADLGDFDGRSADAAVRAALSGDDPRKDTSLVHSGAMWVAVLVRSWKPAHVTAKQTTTLDLKQAT